MAIASERGGKNLLETSLTPTVEVENTNAVTVSDTKHIPLG
jgi:hypothetical protein